jgi:hypothetical protein
MVGRGGASDRVAVVRVGLGFDKLRGHVNQTPQGRAQTSAWRGPVNVAAARSRLCAIAVQITPAEFAAKRPEGRCASGPSLPRCGARFTGIVKGTRSMAIELAELIAQLRAELTAAMAEGAGEHLRFELGPVELELAVQVDKEAKSGGKVRFWVVDAGAEGKLGSSTTQKIKLTLHPQQAGLPGVKPVISGPERKGER